MRPRLEAVHEVAAGAAEKGKALGVAESTISELRASLGGLQSQLSTSTSEAAGLRSRLAEYQVELDRAHGRVAALVSDGEVLREAERRAVAGVEAALGRNRELEAELGAARKEADAFISQRWVCSSPHFFAKRTHTHARAQ